MAKEFKEYKYKRIAVYSWLIIVFLHLVLWFIFYYLEGDILFFRIVGILSLLFALYWIALFIHAVRSVSLATTEDEIIFSPWPLRKPLCIPVRDIIKVRIRDKLIWPGIEIWYDYRDEVRKVIIVTKSLRKEDQVEFRKYVEGLTKS